ncbi:MAG: class B sortase [Erysipelotrichaceae bacterium]|nr:class B sortase [Erysipelotrichaceae bacterium]
MKKKKKKKSKAVRVLLDIIFVAALITAGYSGYRLYTGMQEYNESREVYDDISQQVIVHKDIEDQGFQIDWNTLKNQNADTAGWIRLKDSHIDYPFVYANDNAYYLTHLFDGTYNRSGCVFVDANNQHNFQDKNTVLYAHHMRNGTMFADVENYKDSSYYSTHKEIEIYTPEQNYIMYPVAGIVTTGTDNYVRYSFTDDSDYMNYVKYFTDRSTFQSDEIIQAEDQMVMLSTCSYDVTDGRYVLIGKLVKK